MLSVSDKTVSGWETGRGLPDITMPELLAMALQVSLSELISGSTVKNGNISANMLKTVFYVCPLCGNIRGTGEEVCFCRGIELHPLVPEEPDEAHKLRVEPVEDGYFVSADHDMTRTHYISFLAAAGCSPLSKNRGFFDRLECPEAEHCFRTLILLDIGYILVV